MDIFGAATYFDGLSVLDAYSNAYLFTAQMDQYDATERDSMTGFRRSCSAGAVVLPARGVVSISSGVFLAGRTVKDYFQSSVIREHLLLHPSDGLFTKGAAKAFLEGYSLGLTTFYGALALRKERKEEGESSQLFNLYNIYMAKVEACTRDQIVQSPNGGLFRVASVELQTGGYKTLFVAELEDGALLDVVYTPASGGYNPVTDTTVAGTAVLAPALLEKYQTNYRYMTAAAAKYLNGDMVLTLNTVNITTPAANDRVVANGVAYQVLEKQPDGSGCWELHIRPAPFDLVGGP